MLFLKIFLTTFLLIQCHAKQVDYQTLKCPPHITKFAGHPLTGEYFECERVGEPPVRKSCTADHIYHAVDQKCLSKHHHRERKAAEVVDELTLGRHVSLGDLYNARTNKIWTGTSFWSPATVKKHQYKSNVPNTKTEFFVARTSYERMAKMDINAELKLSFMSGLIQVEGSAGYLRDSMESDDQVNFNMAYFSTTHAMVLSADTPKDNKDWCANKDATHVVISITYGMGANFVFKRMTNIDESNEKILGYLKVAVKSIPGMAIEGHAKLNITGEQKKFRSSIGVTLYGDFILEEQPTTYEQSIKVFKTIPQKMGSAPDYKSAAPMKMKLMPKRFFCSEGDNILNGISEQLLATVSTILNNADQLKIKLRGLIAKDPSARFLPVRRNLQDIEQRLSSEISSLQSKLQTILPQIRANSANSGEGDLIVLLSTYHASPLQYDTCSRFLSHRTREIVAIDTLLTQFTTKNNILVVDYEEATGVIEILVTPYVVIFNLNILQPHSVTTDFLTGKTTDESDMWFNKQLEVGKMGQKLRQFIDFALENGAAKDYSYLVKINPVQTTTLAIDAMKNGHTISSDFTVPTAPNIPQQSSSTHDSVTFDMPDHKLNLFVTGVQVIGWKAAEPHVKFQKTFEYAGNNAGLAVIEGLTSGVSYRFQTKFITEVGLSPASPTTDVITTVPSSPPSNYDVTQLTRDTVIVEWQPPLEIGEKMSVISYDVDILDTCDITDNYRVDENTADKSLGTLSSPGGAVDCCDLCRAKNGKAGLGLFAFMFNHNNKQCYCRKAKVGSVLKFKPGAGHSAGRCCKANGVLVQHQTATASARRVTFSRLTRATTYQICIKAVLSAGGGHQQLQSNCLSFPITTLPDPPNTPKVSAIGLNSATITWSSGTTAAGANLLRYLVYFAQTDGNKEVSGTAIERRAAPANTQLVLGDLVIGTTYVVMVKVLTTKGDSAYSSKRLFKTQYKQTELEKFKSAIITTMRTEYLTEFDRATKVALDKIKKDDEDAVKSLNDLSAKYDAMKQNRWPAGSYCIFQGISGNCPSGFQEHNGYINGIATKLLPNQKPKTKGIIKGMNFGKSSMGCYSRFCGYYHPYNGELQIYACCK